MADCSTEQLENLSVQFKGTKIETTENNKENNSTINSSSQSSTTNDITSLTIKQSTLNDSTSSADSIITTIPTPKKKRIFAKIHLLNRDGSSKNHYEMKKSRIIIGSEGADILVQRPGVYPSHAEIIYDKEKKRFYLNPLVDPYLSDSIRINFIPFVYKQEILGNNDIISVGYRSVKIEFVAKVIANQLPQPDQQYIAKPLQSQPQLLPQQKPSLKQLQQPQQLPQLPQLPQPQPQLQKQPQSKLNKPIDVSSNTNTTSANITTSSTIAAILPKKTITNTPTPTTVSSNPVSKPLETNKTSTAKQTTKNIASTKTPPQPIKIKKSINDDDYEDDYQEDNEKDNGEEKEEQEEEEEEEQPKKKQTKINKQPIKSSQDDISCKKGTTKTTNIGGKETPTLIKDLNLKGIINPKDSLKTIIPTSSKRQHQQFAPLTPTKQKKTTTSTKVVREIKPTVVVENKKKVTTSTFVTKKLQLKVEEIEDEEDKDEEDEENEEDEDEHEDEIQEDEEDEYEEEEDDDDDDGKQLVELKDINKIKKMLAPYKKKEFYITEKKVNSLNREKKLLIKCLEGLKDIQWRVADIGDEDSDGEQEYNKDGSPRYLHITSFFENVPNVRFYNDQFLVNYYSLIENPMSINYILNKIIDDPKYNQDKLLIDFNQIIENAYTFNGEISDIFWLGHYCKIELHKSLLDAGLIEKKYYQSIKKLSESKLDFINQEYKSNENTFIKIIKSPSSSTTTAPSSLKAQNSDQIMEDHESDDINVEEEDEDQDEEEEIEDEEEDEEEEDDDDENVQIDSDDLNERDQLDESDENN